MWVLIGSYNIYIRTILEQKTVLEDPTLENEDCAVICEILKVIFFPFPWSPWFICIQILIQVIFNLTVSTRDEDTSDLIKIATTLNRLLRITIRDQESRLKIVSNCVNCITNMEGSPEAFSELVAPTDIQLPAEPDIPVEGGGMANTALQFVDFLEVGHWHLACHCPGCGQCLVLSL